MHIIINIKAFRGKQTTNMYKGGMIGTASGSEEIIKSLIPQEYKQRAMLIYKSKPQFYKFYDHTLDNYKLCQKLSQTLFSYLTLRTNKAINDYCDLSSFRMTKSKFGTIYGSISEFLYFTELN